MRREIKVKKERDVGREKKMKRFRKNFLVKNCYVRNVF